MTSPSENDKILALLRVFAEYPRQLLYKLTSQIAGVYAIQREQEQDVFDKPEFAQDMLLLKKEWLIKVEGAAAKNSKLTFNQNTVYDTWVSIIDRGADALREGQIPLSEFGGSSRPQRRKPRKTTAPISKTPAGIRNLVDQKREELPTRATLNHIAASIAARQGQKTFRDDLLRAYGNTCLVTGPNIQDILEAAHIQPYADGGPSELPNGLLLRADIHTLFDLYLLAIDEEKMTVLTSPYLLETPYADLDGAPLQFPDWSTDRPSKVLLRKHRQTAGL